MQKLSARQFEQITQSLTSDRSVRIHEKREKPRVGFRSTLDVLSVDKTRQCISSSVWVRDISADGLGLVSAEPLAEGAAFVAEFDRTGNSPLSLLYKVAYCRPLPDGIFSVGAHLHSVLRSRSRDAVR